LGLYQARGFSQVGMRKNYYPGAQGREDALILVLDL
jgi:ribosomal-protein-alanine N-acetyltransferase